ncbi:hypothetical protein Tco_0958305 [Tanacetum coccineum]
MEMESQSLVAGVKAQLLNKLLQDLQSINEELANFINTPNWNRPAFCDNDDDEEYTIAITPVLPTVEPDNFLIMKDKHLDTIPVTESDELIKSSVEDLVHTPSESDGISESECDLPVCDDSSPKRMSLIESVLNRDNVISSPKIDFLLEEFAGKLALIAPIPPGIVEADFDSKGDIYFIENFMYDNSFPRPPETLKDDSETVIDSNNDYSLSDDDSPYSEDIDYVDALPPDPELVSLEVVNLLIAKIEALKANPTPSSDFVTKFPFTSFNFFLEETNTFDNSLPQFETFNFLDDHTKETSSGSTTNHADISLPEYDSFHLDSEPKLGNFTMDVVEDIPVDVPNILPTHPTLHMDFNFIPSHNDLGSNLDVSSPSGDRNKIYDLGICNEDKSTRFLATFSPVIDTLLPFSS